MRRQVGSPDCRHELIVGGPDDAFLEPEAIVAGRNEETLALCREFFEDRIECRRIRSPPPRAAELLARPIARHLIDDRDVVVADVDDELRETGRHRERLLHIEDLLGVIALAGAFQVRAVHGLADDGNVVLLTNLCEIVFHVGDIVAAIFEQS